MEQEILLLPIPTRKILEFKLTSFTLSKRTKQNNVEDKMISTLLLWNKNIRKCYAIGNSGMVDIR